MRFFRFAFCLLIVFLIYGCQEDSQEKVIVEKLKIGTFAGESSSLIWVTEAKNFFKRYNLEAEILEFPAGRYALDSLLEGKVDFAVSGDFTFVKSSFTNPELRILYSISEAGSIRLLARKDRGIRNIEDLKGKKIGVTQKSSGEFSLAMHLTLNQLSMADIRPVFLTPAQMEGAILRGAVDAVLTWAPYVIEIKEKLDQKAVDLTNSQLSEVYLVLSTTLEVIRDRERVLKQLTKALREGEKFIENNKQEAMDIVKKRLRIRYSAYPEVWDSHVFQLTLTQNMLIDLENQARWIIQHSQKRQNRKTLNFLWHIEPKFLKEVKPEGVTVIYKENEE
jgi:NitT/TauT family transport system substrate-binding protein